MMALVLLLACACSTTHSGSFKFSESDMTAAFGSWYAKAPPKTRATIDALDQDETIHIIRGRVADKDSRGASSSPASSRPSRKQCIMHPATTALKPERDWDVVFDEELQQRQEAKLGLPNPVEALLQHEIMGHIVPALLDPSEIYNPSNDNEPKAVRQENDYRKHVGLPLVPVPRDKD
jgi:hypothetical protein